MVVEVVMAVATATATRQWVVALGHGDRNAISNDDPDDAHGPKTWSARTQTCERMRSGTAVRSGTRCGTAVFCCLDGRKRASNCTSEEEWAPPLAPPRTRIMRGRAPGSLELTGSHALREMGGAPGNLAPRNLFLCGLSNHQAGTARMGT